MHNQINKIMSKELAITVVEADKIRQYLDAMNLTTNLTKSQVQQFIEISQAFGLNPFKREIYASKYGDNFSIIVGYETYIKRAERSGRLAGWQVTTMGTLAENNLKAVITIHRKDWEYPFTHEVYYSEYVQLILRTSDRITMDFNPSLWKSWLYDLEGQPDVFYTITTYKDNPFLPVLPEGRRLVQGNQHIALKVLIRR